MQSDHADLEDSALTVEVLCGQAHDGLDATSVVIADPSSPDRSAEASRCAGGIVTRDCSGAACHQGFGDLLMKRHLIEQVG